MIMIVDATYYTTDRDHPGLIRFACDDSTRSGRMDVIMDGDYIELDVDQVESLVQVLQSALELIYSADED